MTIVWIPAEILVEAKMSKLFQLLLLLALATAIVRGQEVQSPLEIRENDDSGEIREMSVGRHERSELNSSHIPFPHPHDTSSYR